MLSLIQCNGQRPVCSRCTERSLDCAYDALEGETKSMSLKRKYQDLEDENTKLRDLYDLIRESPANDAQAIFDRIRKSSSPLEVLCSIHDAATLLPKPLPGTPVNTDPRILRLEAEALSHAPIKLHARPWTVVVGDGLVSELISDFFAYSHLYFFPPMDREAFLKDMMEGDVEKARYCSPLLVNALCAHRCVSEFHTMRSTVHD